MNNTAEYFFLCIMGLLIALLILTIFLLLEVLK